MFLFSIADGTWMMFVFLIPYFLGSIAGPNLNAYMTKQFPNNEQGKLQGGLTSLISLSTIIGPIAMTSIFYYFTSDEATIHFPEAPFFVAGVLIVISFFITYRTLSKMESAPDLK